MSNRRKVRILINTKDLKSGTPTDFTIAVDAIHDIYQFEVETVSIPNVSYNVNSNNNKFYGVDSANTLTSIIPVGNYTSAEILVQLKTSLDATFIGTHTVTIGAQSEKITIATTDTLGLNFGTNTLNSIAFLLGYNNVDVAVASSQLAPNVFDLSYTHNIFIESNLVTKMDDKVINTGSKYRPVLVVIDKDTTYGSILHQSPNSRLSFRSNINSLREIQIKLKDDNGDPFGGDQGLNGRHWNGSIIIHYLQN